MNFLSRLNRIQYVMFSSKLLKVIAVMMVSVTMWGQNFDNFGKAKLLKVNGGVSANTVFYEGATNRDPFTYYLNGNINFNIKGIYNIPLSFAYTNQEFETNRPFTFNRLSLHPSYKWVTAHIGDVNMTFSPYTLNGHQFSGFGGDLVPNKPYQISFMYGRLQKEVAYIAQDSLSIPVYKRLGYGVKANYKFEKWDVSAIAFKATDDTNSIERGFPATFGVTPKDNFVGSVAANFNVFQKLQFSTELANSVITEDVDADASNPNKTALSSFVQTNATTQQFTAYNMRLTYPVASGTIGASYERIDPDYRTLGAYFFNNDLENVTINASQTILKGKVSVAVNGGVQRDDLNNAKDSQLQRIVTSANVGYNPNEKTGFTASYSNFQSYTNIKNQFDVINELRPTDNIDTLDFQQISKNANLGITQQIKNTKKHTQNLNLNFSLQTAVSLQNETITENGESNFYNASGAYNLGWPQQDLTVSTSANVTLNEIGIQKNLTLGPTVNINKLFFDKKLRTSLSTSYNQNMVSGEKQSEVLNLRGNAGYIVAKKHNFNLSVLSQLRNSINIAATQDFTATLSYSYSFDNFKLKIPKPDPRDRKAKAEDPSTLKFTYRDNTFEGTKSAINTQLREVQNKSEFKDIPNFKREELAILLGLVVEEQDNGEYKKKAGVYLDQLYGYKDYSKVYLTMAKSVINNLHKQMGNIDYQLEQRYVNAYLELKDHALYNNANPDKPLPGNTDLQDSYKQLKAATTKREQKLAGHRWMEPLIASYVDKDVLPEDDDLLQKFLALEKDKVYRMYTNAPIKTKIESYLLGQLIDFYFKASLKDHAIEEVTIKHTRKN